MSWTINYTETALRQLSKIDKKIARRIVDYMDNQNFGKPLKGHLGEFWRYRVGDYRIISNIHDNRLNILVIQIGHRKDIYRPH